MKNLTVTFLIASALSLIGACGQEGQEDSFEFTEEAGTDESAMMAVEAFSVEDGEGCRAYGKNYADASHFTDSDGSLSQCRNGTWEWLCGGGHPTKPCCD